MPLKQTQILSAAPGVHVDGNGLYLNVSRKGAKSWIFRYQLNSRRREMGLGSLAALPAPEARAKVAQLKLMVAKGVDPLAEREAERRAAEEEQRMSEAACERLQRTFRAAAERHSANFGLEILASEGVTWPPRGSRGPAR